MINEVYKPDANAEYKILVQNKPATALFNSGASVPVISKKCTNICLIQLSY